MLRHSEIAACSSFPEQNDFIFFQDSLGGIRQITFDGTYTGGSAQTLIAVAIDAKWHTPLAVATYTKGQPGTKVHALS